MSWGLDRIDQQLGLDAQYGYTRTAPNVNVYIIGTGIFGANPDFGGRVAPGLNFSQDSYGTLECYHGSGSGSVPGYGEGLGTHAASVVGGATYGVAKGVRLHPVKWTSRCPNTHFMGWGWLAIAIDWVRNNAVKPAIAVLPDSSVGGLVPTGPALGSICTALQNLALSGVLIVVPAESGVGAQCRNYVTTMIRVAGLKDPNYIYPRGDVALYPGSYQSLPDLYAPAEHIFGARPETIPMYSYFQLTSSTAAAALVAGAAALYLDAYPSATPTNVRAALMANSSPTMGVVYTGFIP